MNKETLAEYKKNEKIYFKQYMKELKAGSDCVEQFLMQEGLGDTGGHAKGIFDAVADIIMKGAEDKHLTRTNLKKQIDICFAAYVDDPQ